MIGLIFWNWFGPFLVSVRSFVFETVAFLGIVFVWAKLWGAWFVTFLAELPWPFAAAEAGASDMALAASKQAVVRILALRCIILSPSSNEPLYGLQGFRFRTSADWPFHYLAEREYPRLVTSGREKFFPAGTGPKKTGPSS